MKTCRILSLAGVVALSLCILVSCSAEQIAGLKQVAADAAESARLAEAEVQRLEAELGAAVEQLQTTGDEHSAKLVADLLAKIEATRDKRDDALSTVEGVAAKIGAAEGGWELADILAGIAAGFIPGAGGIYAILRGALKRKEEQTAALVRNIETARVNGASGDANIVLDHNTFKAANVASGLQPIIYGVLGKASS